MAGSGSGYNEYGSETLISFSCCQTKRQHILLIYYPAPGGCRVLQSIINLDGHMAEYLVNSRIRLHPNKRYNKLRKNRFLQMFVHSTDYLYIGDEKKKSSRITPALLLSLDSRKYLFDSKQSFEEGGGGGG